MKHLLTLINPYSWRNFNHHLGKTSLLRILYLNTWTCLKLHVQIRTSFTRVLTKNSFTGERTSVFSIFPWTNYALQKTKAFFYLWKLKADQSARKSLLNIIFEKIDMFYHQLFKNYLLFIELFNLRWEYCID